MTNDKLDICVQLRDEIQVLSTIRSLITEGEFTLKLEAKDNRHKEVWDKVYNVLNYSETIIPILKKCEEAILESFDIAIEKRTKEYEKL